jgi:hypothetical protein
MNEKRSRPVWKTINTVIVQSSLSKEELETLLTDFVFSSSVTDMAAASAMEKMVKIKGMDKLQKNDQQWSIFSDIASIGMLVIDDLGELFQKVKVEKKHELYPFVVRVLGLYSRDRSGKDCPHNTACADQHDA